MISKAQLVEWKALCDLATPGPWTHSGQGLVEDESEEIDFSVWREVDANFIAAARTAVPALIARVEYLESELEKAWKINSNQKKTNSGGFHENQQMFIDRCKVAIGGLYEIKRWLENNKSDLEKFL